jgi:hypothetical protein
MELPGCFFNINDKDYILKNSYNMITTLGQPIKIIWLFEETFSADPDSKSFHFNGPNPITGTVFRGLHNSPDTLARWFPAADVTE